MPSGSNQVSTMSAKYKQEVEQLLTAFLAVSGTKAAQFSCTLERDINILTKTTL